MRVDATGIEEYKIVPIYTGSRVGRTMSPKTAAARNEEAFIALCDSMSKVRRKLRTKQLGLFDGDEA